MVTDLAWKGEANLHPGVHVATVAMVTDLSWKGEANLHPGVHVATVAMVTDLSWKSGMVRGTCILESHSNCCHDH